MRVVAGSAKGRELAMVPGRTTRPIMDRVKASLFDILRPRIEGVDVLDVFAGSGGVGIEALSQGAAHCTFLDLEPKAVAVIRKNLAATGLAGRASVHQFDALRFLRTTPQSFDLIYVAPPQYRDMWVETMAILAGRPGLLRRRDDAPEDEFAGGLVVVQIHPKEYRELGPGPLRETRQKRYGNTLLIFYEPAPDWPGGEAARPDEGEAGPR
ncbi:Ribosomal RNA small subunit methyltransferase D [Aquisphaera giovannonii]|uniref:Ribosomal RNA small subunit methyltransferase D n=1 Tax=Aquisphaera giovannonii TaxID=406548 RepID=A0A5B9VXB0_9BACT|nr:16S rRNA (guanine(966)-N(2))-methyltransferase RsmD [Aquisphaera giovannonii]QEH32902.1 Ribosomal RNA small subunit methyltransferase D [Aquisphaera giovannonii]